MTIVRTCLLTLLFGLGGSSAVQRQGLEHLKVRLFHQHLVILSAHAIGSQRLHSKHTKKILQTKQPTYMTFSHTRCTADKCKTFDSFLSTLMTECKFNWFPIQTFLDWCDQQNTTVKCNQHFLMSFYLFQNFL